MFGEVEKVYFSHKLMLWFDECNTFPVSEVLKETNTEMCRYILFKTNQKITSYLRSSCLSDVRIAEKNLISFDSTVVGMVAGMSSKSLREGSVLYHDHFDGNAKGIQQIDQRIVQMPVVIRGPVVGHFVLNPK